MVKTYHSYYFVGGEGLEPSSLAAYEPESYVFANFTTCPWSDFVKEISER